MVVAVTVLVFLVVPPSAGPGVPRGLLLAGAGVALSVLVSALLSVVDPRLAPALTAGRERLRALRLGAAAGASDTAASRLTAFIQARAAQPRRSLLALLERLGRSVERTGRREVATLERLRVQLVEDRAVIEGVARLVKEREGLIDEMVVDDPASGLTSLGVFAGIAALAAILTAASMWFLGDFVGGAAVAGVDGAGGSIWPVGERALGLWLSICAVTAGAVLYGLDSNEGAYAHQPPIKAGPYALVLAVAAIQGGAYAAAATLTDVPGRLGIAEGQVLHRVVEYSIVFLGAVGPLVLAALGYAAWLSLDRCFTAVSRWSAARSLDRNTRALYRTRRRLQALSAEVERVRAGGEPAPRHPSGGPSAGSESPIRERNRALDDVRRAAADLRHSGRIGDVELERRTAGQVVGALLGNLLLIGIWGATVLVLYRQLSGQLVGHGLLAPQDARLAAGCVSISLGLAGFVAKDAIWGSAHLALWSSIVPGGRARRAVATIALTFLGAGALVTAWAFAAGPAPDTTAAVSGVYGILLILTLVLASLNLDAGMVAVARGAVLGFYALAWLALMAIRIVLALLEASLFALRRGLAFAALPARWLLGWAHHEVGGGARG